jgi:hypothetical protein
MSALLARSLTVRSNRTCRVAGKVLRIVRCRIVLVPRRLNYWVRRRDIAECPERVPESTAWAANAAGYTSAITRWPATSPPLRGRRRKRAARLTDQPRAAYATGEIEYYAGRRTPANRHALSIESSVAPLDSRPKFTTFAVGRLAMRADKWVISPLRRSCSLGPGGER